MGLQVTPVKIEEIFADEDFNCRGTIAPIDVIDLAKDIKDRGLIQPISLIKLPEKRRAKALEIAYTPNDKAAVDKMRYLIIAGYRRLKAHKINSAEFIDSIIRKDSMSESECIYFNISENVQRKNLNVFDEAKALGPLFEMGFSDQKIQDRLNVKRGWVQVRRMLLKLPNEIQQDVAAGLISHSQIRELFTVSIRQDNDTCLNQARYLKEQKESGKKNISLKALDKNSRRQRRRVEIFALMRYLRTMFGPASRMSTMLAWTSGEINDMELYGRIKEYAEEDGIVFKEHEGPLE